MPRKRMWRVLRGFEWCPKPNVVMLFRVGEVRTGLTRACIEHAGERIQEIKD